MDSEVRTHLKLAGGRFAGGRTKDADGNGRRGGADEGTGIRCDGEESAKKLRFARGAEALRARAKECRGKDQGHEEEEMGPWGTGKYWVQTYPITIVETQLQTET